ALRPESAPVPGEVAVEVDTVGVLARMGRVAVRVHVLHDPEVDPAYGAPLLQNVGDGEPRRLVAVDDGDHDGLSRAGGVTDLDGDQRPAAHGAADYRPLVNEPVAGRLRRECDVVGR